MTSTFKNNNNHLWTFLSPRQLFQPVDASSLAVNRILLGSLLLLDTLQERGLSRAELLWADDRQLDTFQCRFPLFSGWVTRFERPEAMCALYTVLFGGIVGVTLGYHYRLSALLYATAYWYLFLVEKSRWNNHSYLFGLLALVNLLASDGHRKWSVDALRWQAKNNSKNNNLQSLSKAPSVPLWQVAILRFQLFLVYFYAGVKKIDGDWLRGHSMVALSQHWIWSPLTRGPLGVPGHLIDYYVIHLGGFLFDLSVGFLLLIGRTRPLAFALATFFNVANSQMFTIGVFPWVMLAVMPIFCAPDWPVVLAEKLSGMFSKKTCTEKEEKTAVKKMITPPAPITNINNSQTRTSTNLVTFFGAELCRPRWHHLSSYLTSQLQGSIAPSPKERQLTKEDKTKERFLASSTASPPLTIRQRLTLLLLLLYTAVQLTLPFAPRLLLPGYSTWTDGPYGTSWDMMVHNWQHMHTRVTVHATIKQQANQKATVTLYLDPDNWTLNGRWAHHADMAVQFGHCVARQLERHFGGLRATALYLDVWSSLNGRFSQRMYRPGVDLLSFRWSPFQKPSQLVMPILEQSEHWRRRALEVERSIDEYMKSINASSSSSSSSFLLYIADAPDLPLETYIDEALFSGDATLFVLSGRVQVHLQNESGRQFLVRSGGDEDDDLVMSADRTAKLPLGSEAVITVRGCEAAYYALLYSPLLKKNDTRSSGLHYSTEDNNTREVQRPQSTWYSSLRVLFIGGRFLLLETVWLVLKIGELMVALVDEYLIGRLALFSGCRCSWNGWWWWWFW